MTEADRRELKRRCDGLRGVDNSTEVHDAFVERITQRVEEMIAAEREATLREVLRGLRSENDSTQLRAIIASVDAIRADVKGNG